MNQDKGQQTVNTIAHEALRAELALQDQLDSIELELDSANEECVLDAIKRVHQLVRDLGI